MRLHPEVSGQIANASFNSPAKANVLISRAGTTAVPDGDSPILESRSSLSSVGPSESRVKVLVTRSGSQSDSPPIMLLSNIRPGGLPETPIVSPSSGDQRDKTDDYTATDTVSHRTRGRGPVVTATAGVSALVIALAACGSRDSNGQPNPLASFGHQLEQAGKNALHGAEKNAGQIKKGVEREGPIIGHHLEQAGRNAVNGAKKDEKKLEHRVNQLTHPSPSNTPHP